MRFIYYPLVAALLLFFSGCSPYNAETSDAAAVKTIVWYLPSNDSYKDAGKVNDALNDKIHSYYPDINVKLNFINIHEYAQKMSVYLSAGEQADIVWVNDSVLSYINYPQDSIYKFIDAPITSYAPNLNSRLNGDDDSLYKIYDKKYFIPVTEHCGGLIPFIKIPAELSQYMDISKLTDAVNRGECADETLLSVITNYLDTLKENKLLSDGVDFASVSRLFPMIGYETFVSTNDTIGYRIDDSSFRAVDMLNTESFRTAQKVYGMWYQNGYIRDDISITYKQGADSTYRHVLSGAWGYEKNNRYFITMDGYEDGYIYIAADNKYHTKKLFSDSAVIIPTSSKMSDTALKILDLFYTHPELYNLITFGIEGVHYNIENGRANVYQNNYRCFANIVPGSGEILSTLQTDMVIPADMRTYPYTAGMFIPSASKEFRKKLFDYVNVYGVKNYSFTPIDNSGSEIASLLNIYNQKASME